MNRAALRKPSIEQLISRECANFSSSDPGFRPASWCDKKEVRCPVIAEGEACPYLEEYVLPAHPDMYDLYCLAIEVQS